MISKDAVDETTPLDAPRRVNELRSRITRLAGSRGITVKRLQGLIAGVVLAQMLPDSAVKGGTGLKLRFGDSLTRETPDLDTAFRGDLDAFQSELEQNLTTKWHAFGGRVREGQRRAPDTVPHDYAMQPYRVSLTYLGKDFAGVDLEVGYDELEATTIDGVEKEMSAQILGYFEALGLPRPRPVRVLPLHHQIAQKLHACTEPGNDRAHDLVDLQLMADKVDLELVARTAARLFAFRRQHSWADAQVRPGTSWDSLYDLAAVGLTVSPNVVDAAIWANDYLESLRQTSAALGSAPHETV